MLNLNSLEERLTKTLNFETVESLNEFLQQERRIMKLEYLSKEDNKIMKEDDEIIEQKLLD